MRLYTLLAAYGSLALAFSKPAKRDWDAFDYYVLEHHPASGLSVDDAAVALGAQVVGPAGELPDHWIVRSSKTAVLNHKRAPGSISYLEKQSLRQRVKRDGSMLDPTIPTTRTKRNSSDIASALGISDPEFHNQWHLVNDVAPANSMNVSGLWSMGITGKGVISAMVDDGLDYTSDDLATNFDALGSYDFNDHTDLPTPVNSDDNHGTRCAGEIAAGKNNACGIGIAHDSKIAGIRILSGPISDIDEATALNYGYHSTSIYSCSWGPTDDGKSMEGPSYLVEKAFVNGVQKGRDGKGSIYVFASGNGAWADDQCNFDGFTNSIYTITVAAIDHRNMHPSYSESCAANLVVAYSSGNGKSITTTDVARDGSSSKCTSGHSGTSAAAPNAAGVFALALSVRPELTWRDMQHIAVRTAVRINPDDKDWEKTAQGRWFSYKYGYGALDGYAYVMLAKTWTPVKPQAWLELPHVQINNGTMDLENNMNGGQAITQDGVTSSITIANEMLIEANLEALEHITVKVWIDHTQRGDVRVEILSPSGVRSVLAAKRRYDSAKTGFPGWRFMSLKHWGEDPTGKWTIRVSHDPTSNKSKGHFLGWSMSLWGSSIDASVVKQWNIPKLANVFPPIHPDDAEVHPVASASISLAATSTKSYVHPTAMLPDNHTEHEGEAEHPAFPDTPLSSASPSPSAGPGWVSDTTAFVSDQKYLIGVLVVIFAVLAGVGVCLRRRAIRRRHAQYAAVSDGENLPLRSINAQHDPQAAGDDEDADEETGLRSGLGFHSEFLHDEDLNSPGPSPRYRDEPEGEPKGERRLEARSLSDDSGSGESWEHASKLS